MDPIVWEREPPQLRSPVLVASFSGWNDAASAASTALGAIGGSLETELIARIDPEEFFDFQANRPTIEISDGELQGVEWPDNLIVAATAAGRRTRSAADQRHRAEHPLARLLQLGPRRRRGLRGGDRRHVRLPDRRRRPHPPGADHGAGHRRDDDRPARLRRRRLRGPDRGRSGSSTRSAASAG